MSKSVTSRRSFIKKKQKEKGDKSNEEIKVSNFRGSPKVLKISKSNYYYLINREKYDITKIMMMIDYGRLSTLGHRFRKYPEGIDKIEFVALLANVLKEDKMPVYELTDLIYGIYKFFCEIDFNGDNKMEWAEFTQFIIDKVEGEHNNVEREKDNKNKISIVPFSLKLLINKGRIGILIEHLGHNNISGNKSFSLFIESSINFRKKSNKI